MSPEGSTNGKEDLVHHFVLKGRVDYAARSSDYICPLGTVIISKMPADINCGRIRMMIENGADIKPCSVSRTPLELAVMTYTENISVVKLLLDCGADVNATGDTDHGDDFIFGGPDDFSTPLERVENWLLVGNKYDAKLAELLKSRGR